jgi:predicted PurR-regulated permease PerM
MMLLLSLWPPSRLPYWINKLFNWYFFTVVNEAIQYGLASFTRTIVFISVCVFWRELMAALAMCLRAFFVCMCLYSFLQSGLIARIQCLFLSRCPAAVIRFVVSIIVNPVKRQTIRTLTHVITKLFKSRASRIYRAPLLANRDASAAPVFIVCSERIRAPLNHVRPSVVKSLFSFISHNPSKERVIMITQYNGVLP